MHSPYIRSNRCRLSAALRCSCHDAVKNLCTLTCRCRALRASHLPWSNHTPIQCPQRSKKKALSGQILNLRSIRPQAGHSLAHPAPSSGRGVALLDVVDEVGLRCCNHVPYCSAESHIPAHRWQLKADRSGSAWYRPRKAGVGQTGHCKLSFCCFMTLHSALQWGMMNGGAPPDSATSHAISARRSLHAIGICLLKI